MFVWAPTTPSDVPRIKQGSFNLSQAAGTYDILTATGGDVYVEVLQVFGKTAAAGLVSALVKTNHTAGDKSIMSSVLLVSLLGDAIHTIVTDKFVLPSGKKIQGTIVGTGSGGELAVVVRYTPLTAGATLV